MQEVKVVRTLITTFLGIILRSALVSSQSVNDCTFDLKDGEVSTCNLIMDASAFKFESWKTGVGSTFAWLGGPAEDAQENTSGGYVFTSISDMLSTFQQPKKAWMVTSPSNSTGALGRCLQFAHAIGGLGIKSLEVRLLTYDNEDVQEALANDTIPLQYEVTSLWRTKQTTHGDWQKVQLTFSTMQEYSIVFSASPDTRYSNYRGYAAIDDIAFTVGPCDNECMFDLDFCSWANNDTGDNFDWVIGRSSAKRGTGPSRDQTSSLINRIYAGGYAYADSSFPRLPLETAMLVSSAVQPTEKPLCLHFWLNVHGGGVGNVRVLFSPVSSSSKTKELWSIGKGIKSGTDIWYPCQQTIASTEEFRIIFEATVGIPGSGDVGLDTIKITQGSCPSLPPGSSSGWSDCTFLDDTCGWQIPTPDSFDCTFLSRVAGGKYNPAGHTESVYEIADMYMKFDLNCYKNRARDRAAMVSSTLTLDTDVCLSFWVMMYTNVASQTYVGALRVILQYPDKNVTVWRLQNQQHASWTYAQVKVPATPSVKVAIEGLQGPKVMGMIGVDDIAMFPLACSLEPASAMVQPADCTFDHDLCLWKVEASDQGGSSLTKWHLASGEKVLLDHTFYADRGGFAYVESFNTKYTSRLRGPVFPQNQTFCFTFWFTEVYEDFSAKISLIRTSEGKEDVLWSVLQDKIVNPGVSKNNVINWRYAQVPLASHDTDYELVLEGEVMRSAWAIDDFHVIPDRDDCRLEPSYAQP